MDLLVQGFGSSIPLVGDWSIKNGIAEQNDEDAFYAKLATPLIQEKGVFTYTFSAKSDARGRGWVGIGLHVFTPKSYTLKGYGSGDSLCVWLTRDPAHLSSDITRIQLYRSVSDWDMKLLDEVPVEESIYEYHEFQVTVDTAGGTVTISLDGVQRLSEKGVLDLSRGVFVVLRALDRAEFKEFRVEARE